MPTNSHQPSGNGNSHPPALPPVEPVGKFSLADTDTFRCPLRLLMPTFLVGLGTTGSRIVDATIRLFTGMMGHLPKPLGYLLIDADAPGGRMDRAHFRSQGIDGAGTNPHNGRKLFEKYRKAIAEALISHVTRLFQGDAALPTDKSAREATSFVVVAGPGGTSGGSIDPMISLLHEVARRFCIQEPRMHAVLLGPQMATNDLSRTIAPEQVELILATYAENLRNIYAHIAAEPRFPAAQPNGDGLPLQYVSRVFSVQTVDQTNGQADLPTTDEFVAMVARNLFFQHFTPSGNDHMARTRDHRGYGAHSGYPQ